MKKSKTLGIVTAAAIIAAILSGCASMTVVSVDSVEGPKQVRQYQDIIPSAIKVMAGYKDGSPKQAKFSQGDIIFDNTRVGSQTVKVKVGNGYEASFQTEVMALKSITASVPPESQRVRMGSKIDWTKIKVTGQWDQMGNQDIPFSVYNDASIRPKGSTPGPYGDQDHVSGLDSISDFGPYKAGTHTITMTYKGMKTSFNVISVPMKDFRIVKLPKKVEYLSGQGFDTEGMELEGIYEGLPNAPIRLNPNDITGYDSNKLGRQTLTVTINGIKKTFDVNVTLNLNGTWQHTTTVGTVTYTATYTFNNGSYETSINNVPLTKGTYTRSGNNFILTPTDLNGGGYVSDSKPDVESKWYALSELPSSISGQREFFNKPFTLTVVSGNTFKIGEGTFTKK